MGTGVDNYSNIDQQLSTWIDEHSDELLTSTQELLRIPSVRGDAATDAPYGAETARALKYVLGVAAGHGMSIRNLGGHAGHAEWRPDGVAEDAEIVGVLAHVDVVPEGDSWTHPPFGAEVDKGILYGRGAVDDKGPAMAGLFGMLAIAACGVPATKRVRVILGCDEESSFGCVNHYFANEEMPVTGFTPDGRFPVIFAEKGIANLEVEMTAPFKVGDMELVSLTAGRRSNMVPDLAVAVIEGPIEQTYRLSTALPEDAVEVSNGHARLTITARGVSAHGSTPELGINALTVLVDMLERARLPMSPEWGLLDTWAGDTSGAALGIDGRDDIAGPLTSNLGIASYKEGKLSLTFNIRYPVTWTIDELTSKARPVVQAARASLVNHVDMKPLYVPVDDPLMQVLLDVYRAETGDMRPPLTMGGGTYARVMKKGVAFGPEFEGFNGGAHQPDEHWPVEHLIRAAKIYAKALARLAA